MNPPITQTMIRRQKKMQRMQSRPRPPQANRSKDRNPAGKSFARKDRQA
ncbi:MAG: hypothetical protein HOJ49_01755 [Nitrospina sp.]|nr:hypothetical protein [Nitrospina sp.]